jgi:DsbC/DsbD-like thiol-disulfide interchange protein
MVRPRDPARPVDLALDLHYAACDRICVPAEAHATLRLVPDAAPTPQAERVAAFAARVPRPAGKPGAPAIRLARAKGDKHVWHVVVTPAPEPGSDIFPEAPDGWFFDTKATPGGFDLLLAQKPEGSGGAIELGLTLVEGERAFDMKLSLDAAAARP